MKRRTLIAQHESAAVSRQHKAPCSDCPWRRDAVPGWLGGRAPAEWTRAAHDDSIIDCHTKKKTTAVLLTMESPRIQWQCAGAAVFRANVNKVPRDPDALDLEPNTKRVFASNAEFEAHHARRRT